MTKSNTYNRHGIAMTLHAINDDEVTPTALFEALGQAYAIATDLCANEALDVHNHCEQLAKHRKQMLQWADVARQIKDLQHEIFDHSPEKGKR